MMAERLAEIRRDLDSEAYTSYLPKTVRELLDYIDGLKFANGVLDSAAKDAQAWSVRAQTAEAKCAQLEAHKAESMQVFAALQIQEIAKEIGAPLGSGVAEHILPWIKTAKAQLEAQRGGAVVVPESQWQSMESAPTKAYSTAILCDDEGRVGEGVLDDGDWVWRYNEKLAFPTMWIPVPKAPEPGRAQQAKGG